MPVTWAKKLHNDIGMHFAHKSKIGRWQVGHLNKKLTWAEPQSSWIFCWGDRQTDMWPLNVSINHLYAKGSHPWIFYWGDRHACDLSMSQSIIYVQNAVILEFFTEVTDRHVTSQCLNQSNMCKRQSSLNFLLRWQTDMWPLNASINHLCAKHNHPWIFYWGDRQTWYLSMSQSIILEFFCIADGWRSCQLPIMYVWDLLVHFLPHTLFLGFEGHFVVVVW